LAPSAVGAITGSGIRLDPGEPFSERSALLVNTSRNVAVLTSIRQLGTVGELRDGRVYVALGTSSSGPVMGAGEGFPPKYYSLADLHDPKGFRVPPTRTRVGREGVVVMTTGRLAAGETFGMGGYEATYRVGKARYRTKLPHGVAVCAARNERYDPLPLLRRVVEVAAPEFSP